MLSRIRHESDIHRVEPGDREVRRHLDLKADSLGTVGTRAELGGTIGPCDDRQRGEDDALADRVRIARRHDVLAGAGESIRDAREAGPTERRQGAAKRAPLAAVAVGAPDRRTLIPSIGEHDDRHLGSIAAERLRPSERPAHRVIERSALPLGIPREAAPLARSPCEGDRRGAIARSFDGPTLRPATGIHLAAEHENLRSESLRQALDGRRDAGLRGLPAGSSVGDGGPLHRAGSVEHEDEGLCE